MKTSYRVPGSPYRARRAAGGVGVPRTEYKGLGTRYSVLGTAWLTGAPRRGRCLGNTHFDVEPQYRLERQARDFGAGVAAQALAPSALARGRGAVLMSKECGNSNIKYI